MPYYSNRPNEFFLVEGECFFLLKLVIEMMVNLRLNRPNDNRPRHPVHSVLSTVFRTLAPSPGFLQVWLAQNPQ
jgi:hypothetical protein